MAAIRKCRLEIGESAVIMGMGVLGLVAIPLLKAAGAVPIIAVNPVAVKREWLGALRGGNMFFLGCHMVDLVYRIMGKPDKITLFNSSTENDGAEDFAIAVFGYNGIPSFIKANASEKASFERRQLVICGTEATAELKPLETIKDANGNQTTTLTVYTSEKVTTKESELYNRYDTMMLDFAEAVALGKPNNYSLDYELGLYRLLAKCCGINTEK